jgi:predicted dehydrogenase
VPGWEAAAQQGEPALVGHSGFFAAVFKALATGAPMPVTGSMARHTLAIIEAARQASDQRRAVEVRTDATVY